MRKFKAAQSLIKILTLILLFVLSERMLAQKNITGNYQDNFGSRIRINVDGTFIYEYNFDLITSWTKGFWTLSGDTVKLVYTPILDTLNQISEDGNIEDTLVLSSNEIPERIATGQYLKEQSYSGGQNRFRCPEQFLIKKEKLYEIYDNHTLTRKRRGFWNHKKLDLGFSQIAK